MRTNFSNVIISEETTIGSKLNEFINYHIQKGSSKYTVIFYKSTLSHLLNLEHSVDSYNWPELILDIQAKNVSDYSKTTYLRAIRSFINWLGIDIKIHIKEVDTVKEVWTDDEVKILIKKPVKATFTDYKIYTMILLAIDTGMRINSLRKLKINDIQQDSVIVRNTKSNKIQIIPFSATTKTALTTYMKYRNGSADDILFCSVYGNELSKDLPRQELNRYCEKRNIKNKGWHAFRHYFSRHYLLNGGNVFALKQYLGHADLKTTNHYAKLYDKELLDSYKSPIDSLIRKQIKTI